MHRFEKLLSKLPLLIFALSILSIPAFAQVAPNSGTINLQGRVSGYVEVRSGGTATASGGASILNNDKGIGQLFNEGGSTLTVDFGEVGPTNQNLFASAIVPVRLRSNIDYTLAVTAAPMSYSGTPDAESVTLKDIGFGVTAVTRNPTGGVMAGSDTVTYGNGNPMSNGSVNATTGRYEYSSGFSLNDYSPSATTVMNGDRIMQAAVPTGSTNGLMLNAVFAIKPQFFTPSTSFSTTVTFTISATP